MKRLTKKGEKVAKYLGYSLNNKNLNNLGQVGGLLEILEKEKSLDDNPNPMPNFHPKSPSEMTKYSTIMRKYLSYWLENTQGLSNVSWSAMKELALYLNTKVKK